MTPVLVEQNDQTATLRPAGDVVASGISDLRSALRSAIAGGVREMTLDFSEVAMVDSSGLGLLIAAHNSLGKVGGRLNVVHASQEILNLFRSMRIHQHFVVSGD